MAQASRNDELTDKCLEIRRIWQGPGQRSHELANAMQEMFALLPSQDVSIGIHVREDIGASSRVGHG